MTRNLVDAWDAVKKNVMKVIVGKEEAIEQCLIAILAGGHILIEDVPGTGKTTLCKALAGSLNLQFRRIQMTPDLLPSDITGSYVYHLKDSEFRFRPGPIFCNLLLTDEINRATPRTQASLLEAMEEKQVTVEGVTHKLSEPFLVFATQNPVEYQGVYRLPEAQLDRFLMKVTLGYLRPAEEKEMLSRVRETHPLESLQPAMELDELLESQKLIRKIKVSPAVEEYVVQLLARTRNAEEIQLGASPRAGIGLIRSAQARAFLHQRSYITPDDIKALFVPLLIHRVFLKPQFRVSGFSEAEFLHRILEEVPVPLE
ncbi:MAG: AAA family ATPase [bacterium JZ-2024 1]